MEESVLLGTKPLVDSIRHFIRDPSGVFSVCHLCECRIVQQHHDSRLLLLLNWFLTSRLLFRIKSPYNKKNITRWLEDINFMFSWQEQYLTSERSKRVRYCSCHSNIKFISSRHRVISSIYCYSHRQGFSEVFSSFSSQQWGNLSHVSNQNLPWHLPTKEIEI